MAHYENRTPLHKVELIPSILSIITVMLLLNLARAKPSVSYNNLEFFYSFNVPCVVMCLTILRGMWRLSQQESASSNHGDFDQLLHVADCICRM